MGPIIGSELGADVIQASGQTSWADLVWIKVFKYTGRGNMLPPAPVLTLMHGVRLFPFLLALAGICMVMHASLHHGAWISPTIIFLGWVFLTVTMGWM